MRIYKQFKTLLSYTTGYKSPSLLFVHIGKKSKALFFATDKFLPFQPFNKKFRRNFLLKILKHYIFRRKRVFYQKAKNRKAHSGAVSFSVLAGVGLEPTASRL